MKRSVTLLVAGGIVVLLVVGLVVVKNLPKKETSSPGGPSIVLSKTDKDSIISIALQHNGQTVTLKKQGKDWVVDYPVAVSWDTLTLNGIVSDFTNMKADRSIDSSPTDLTQYGLNPPQATAEATLANGTKITFLIGNKTVEGNSYYFMRNDDKTVYTALQFSVDPFLSNLADLRDRSLPTVDTKSLTAIRIVHGGQTIQIVPLVKGEDLSYVSFGEMKMVKPLPVERPVDVEAFEKVFQGYPGYFQIKSFVDDAPTSLAKYGLQPAVYEFELQDSKQGHIDLLLGSSLPDGTVYAKLPDKPSVFTVSKSDISGILDATWFGLEDKFFLIPNIDDVDGFTIKGDGVSYNVSISRTPDPAGKKDQNGKVVMNATYTVNSANVEETRFKAFYQKVIGLLADSPNPNPGIAMKPSLTMTFTINKGDRRTYEEFFVPYNRDFYAVFRDGYAEMLVSRDQVADLLSSAASLVH